MTAGAAGWKMSCSRGGAPGVDAWIESCADFTRARGGRWPYFLPMEMSGIRVSSLYQTSFRSLFGAGITL
jgi:hypothetical protein